MSFRPNYIVCKGQLNLKNCFWSKRGDFFRNFGLNWQNVMLHLARHSSRIVEKSEIKVLWLYFSSFQSPENLFICVTNFILKLSGRIESPCAALKVLAVLSHWRNFYVSCVWCPFSQSNKSSRAQPDWAF